MLDPCQITVTVVDAHHVVAAISGELDLSAGPAVVAALRPHLGARVTIDLAGVTFMDSSAIQCLLQLQTESRAQDGRLAAGAMSPVVRRVLEVCAFDAGLFSP
jgi:anti-sigma B factor antagonist